MAKHIFVGTLQKLERRLLKANPNSYVIFGGNRFRTTYSVCQKGAQHYPVISVIAHGTAFGIIW